MPTNEIALKLQTMIEAPLSWLKQRARMAAFFWVLLLVQLLELALIERRFDLFTGGFLQPYSLLSAKERAIFLGLSLWMDVFFYGGIAFIWFRLASRWRSKPLIAAYNFAFLVSAAIGGWLAVKFKVLSYFNDTIDFLLLQALGGGSLYHALSYVSNETTVFILAGLMLLGAYWVGLRSLRRSVMPESTSTEGRGPTIWITLIMLSLTVGMVHWVNSNSPLRYGLQKKTSYALIQTALIRLTDIDRDGSGFFSYPADSKPLDPLIYPGALDVPGNGIDEDGFAGDFLWQGDPTDPLDALTPRSGDHIVMIVLESARGDLFGRTVNNKAVAPFLTELARYGSSFEYVYSHAGFTVTSLKALFNRTLSHKVDRVRLVDYLRDSGYRLSFISGEDESFGNVADETGMNDPGNYFFDARSALDDRVYPSKEPASLRLSEDRVTRQFLARSKEVDWSEPQFFYINFQAAHFPYHHPNMPAILGGRPIPRSDINAENRFWLENTYWNAIAVADRSVGKILARLEALGVLDDTVVVVLGDHGESLFDDQFLGHGHALNDIQTRIPLVINRSGLQASCALGQVDIAEFVIRVATDRLEGDICAKPRTPILQFIGSLNYPQLIGTVSYGEVRTILDMRTRMVFFSDLGRWAEFDVAIKDPLLKERTRELVTLWEAARWQNYLTEQQSVNAKD